MDDVSAIIAALKRSGFPLQTRVEHEINRQPFGWRFLASEYPWRGRDGEDEFIDLVTSCGTVVLVIECKKAEDRSLLFLRPIGPENTGRTRNFTFRHVERHPEQVSDITLRDDMMEPASYRAQFCVSTDTKNQRLLERDAREVIAAADAVAAEFPRDRLPMRAFIVPVIVTTAALYMLRFQPNDIELATGAFLDPGSTQRQIEPVNWMRFHKTFSARDRDARSVFVVNSGELPDFLDRIARSQGVITTA